MKEQYKDYFNMLYWYDIIEAAPFKIETGGPIRIASTVDRLKGFFNDSLQFENNKLIPGNKCKN